MSEQRWLKPSDILKPGGPDLGYYWCRDIRAGAPWVEQILCDPEGDCYVYGRDYLDKIRHDNVHRYYGPIQPPEYKGE